MMLSFQEKKIWTHTPRDARSVHAQRRDCVRTQQESSNLLASERLSRETNYVTEDTKPLISSCTFGLKMINVCTLFKQPHLEYSVMATWEN